MILKSFKEKAIDKIIRRELQSQRNKGGATLGEVRSLALIINYDQLADFKPLLNLAADLSVSNDQVYILGYVEKIHKKVNYMIPVFSEASVKTSGEVKSGTVKDFLGREYDLLVNYYKDNNPVMQLMSVHTRAKLKVGVSEGLSAINDLTLLTGTENFNEFRQELVKYLKILNKQ
ncbi:DUF6913 domain-containing protein [Robertkochia flava]|uniref:DUF6913 domain-containing protein n=1 Tax=Robertkochia flava TaxID=3447986 RepID=UPI001CCA2C6F|nr:hypothetical protein [Robertkochia marina]